MPHESGGGAMASYVLIVDDEPEIRQTLAEVLDARGHRVLSAGDGQEALDLMRAHGAPSVIVLDLMMPVMDGYQFHHEQRRDPLFAGVPLVVITAGTSVRKEELSTAEVLWKPFELHALVSAVERHC